MKAFCVHGHFYQPSREDPVTGIIPQEPGAAPFHNWNELIYSHCYRPNAELGNFSRISFDLGPTLSDWMKDYDPRTLAEIVAQDRMNVVRNGVGNAMAQSYHHTILPLASREDKITQIRWGIADFEHTFGRKPEGMWLPEAAVDEETLELLVDHGIQFTILAPWQAAQEWVDVTHPYLAPLQGGRQIAAFFYDQELSMRVSFDPSATTNADRFLENFIAPRFRRPKTGTLESQMLLIASDGELYGHHQPFRDKFLAHLTGEVLQQHGYQLTYPALWLKQNPPTVPVRIRSNTSWSCHHGVARWMESCGCTPYGEWKLYLRQAMNKIAAALDETYLKEMSAVVPDPWELRHRYIDVILGTRTLPELLYELGGKDLSPELLAKADLLLRSQFERQRMFTSCGWFFEDFDRIEPRNNTTYAAQAIWLNYQATGQDLYEDAMDWLQPVRSWRTGLQGDAFFQSRFEMVKAESALPVKDPCAAASD